MSAKVFNRYMRRCKAIGHSPSLAELKLFNKLITKDK